MTQHLRSIYDDLSHGRLSQQEALEQIRGIKLREQDLNPGALLLAPGWEPRDVEPLARAAEFTEHHVILCEPAGVDANELERLLPRARCISLQFSASENPARRYSDAALACFERIRGVLESKPAGRVLVQIVAVSAEEHALFAGLSSLLETAALENAHFSGQLILVPPEMTAAELAKCLRDEMTGTLEPLIRYDGGVRQLRRWDEIAAAAEPPPSAFKDDGVYLITGGLGALGVLFAKEILRRTRQAKVVLTGREALSGDRRVLFDALYADGGRVTYRKVDVGDPEQVEQLIPTITDEHRQLNGILHAAGMTADNFILKKTAAEFSSVLVPKVAGTYNLDQASQDIDLDFFVLFSSTAGAVGNVGQADYAAANGFMDHFAAFRNRQVAAGRRRGRTRSINWPLWQAGGMSVDAASLEQLRKTMGMRPMQNATGFDAFHRALALPHDQLLVAEGDLVRLRRAFLGGRPAEIAVVAERVPVAIDAQNLVEKTQLYLRKQLSQILKLSPDQIDPQDALEKYGIDSIMALKLTGQLEQTFGALSKTLFFEYQTIADLTDYFVRSHAARLAELFAAIPGSAPAQTPPRVEVRRQSDRRSSRTRTVPSRGPDTEMIAIVGLGGRYPESVDLEAYWQNLREGKDCITEVPKERWVWQEYFSEDRTKSGQHYSKWGGFIAGVDEFDPLFFNISPKEAKYIDPQERLFLQHAWMALEDAGYTRAALQVPYAGDLPGQVGVYVGVMYNEYQLFGAEASVRGKRMGIGGSAASIANRVSYAFNLHGPSMTLDTMCSSSLTAIHLACQDLKLGRTTVALAGGVNVSIHPNKYLLLSAGQFISSDGHCQSFGEGGDGYIPGEGVGVVVLKRLSDAERDGDHIYGVIRGSALNHGGKTNGYSVPNPQAQASAISRALAESRTDARHVSYIEAHGTGTKLGDPIEITALTKAFREYTEETGFCLIGSAKSNIGHCESAAGIAGLTKVLLQLQHRQLVPSLHSAQLNPHIEFDATPFVVNQVTRSWEQPVIDGRTIPRIAGISSFGAGGANAHVIVEEYQPSVQQPLAFPAVAILLSARTPDQLRQKARDLREFIRPRMDALDLAAFAYTLQIGREAMEERLAFIVSSADGLAEKLDAFVAGEQDIEDTYQGQVRRDKQAVSLFSADADLQQTIDQWLGAWKLNRLLDLWAKGLEVDWSRLYGESHPPRISLPAYPFAKDRYWIEIEPAGAAPAARSVTAVLHPLLHSNLSDLTEQRYRSTFTGDEFFLADHHVRGERVLPAAAQLELARAAIENAVPVRAAGTVLELRDVQWAQPVVVRDRKQIGIALYPQSGGEIEYEIYSDDSDGEIVHGQGRAVWSADAAPARLDLGSLAGRMTRGTVDPTGLYAASALTGVVYGPAFQVIESIRRGDRELLARLRLPASIESTSSDYVLHPSLLDGALQVCAALVDGASGPVEMPALDSLRIMSACGSELVAWVRYSETDAARIDVDLCDSQGDVRAQMRGIHWNIASAESMAGVGILTAAIPLVPQKIAIAAREPQEIAFMTGADMPAAIIGQRKPAGISLMAPAASAATVIPPERRPWPAPRCHRRFACRIAVRAYSQSTSAGSRRRTRSVTSGRR